MTTVLPVEKTIIDVQLMPRLSEVIADIERTHIVYIVARTGDELPFVLAPTVIAYLDYLYAGLPPDRKIPDMMAYAAYLCYPTDRQPNWEPRLKEGDIRELGDIAASPGYTPIMGNVVCSRLLSQYEGIKQQWGSGARNSPLKDLSLCFVYPQAWDLVKQLIEMGADVNERLWHGQTLLMRAASYPLSSSTWKKSLPPTSSDDPALELLRYLIAKGADVNAVDSDGDNALMQMLRYWI